MSKRAMHVIGPVISPGAAFWIAVVCGTAVSSRAAPPAESQSPTAISEQDGSAEASAAKDEHPLDSFLQTAQESRKALGEVKDYTTIFRKMEMVRGKPFTHTMYMKFRRKPFSVYLYFLGEHRGRQVLYVAGKNDGKLLARQPGIGGLGVTVSLKPDSPQAMSEGRHPITQIGMANMLQALIKQWKAERQHDDIQVKLYPEAKLQRPQKGYKPMTCKVLESSHQKRHQNTEFYLTRLYIDKKTELPVRVEQYGYPERPGGKPPLLAEYTYWNVRTNVGLKDIDFDRKNPQYKF